MDPGLMHLHYGFLSFFFALFIHHPARPDTSLTFPCMPITTEMDFLYAMSGRAVCSASTSLDRREAGTEP